MDKFCSNCGAELKEGAQVCLSCGKLIESNLLLDNYGRTPSGEDGKTVATVSVIFGSIGFYPLVIIGSIVGFITALIGINDDKSLYKGRAKLGLWLSITSFIFWILAFIIVFAYGY